MVVTFTLLKFLLVAVLQRGGGIPSQVSAVQRKKNECLEFTPVHYFRFHGLNYKNKCVKKYDILIKREN